jgi:hypothetical protein
MSDYNGYRNWETWNVALWIGNDEGLYRAAVDSARRTAGDGAYRAFVERAGLAGTATPDGAAYEGPTLDLDAIDEVISEFAPQED